MSLAAKEQFFPLHSHATVPSWGMLLKATPPSLPSAGLATAEAVPGIVIGSLDCETMNSPSSGEIGSVVVFAARPVSIKPHRNAHFDLEHCVWKEPL